MRTALLPSSSEAHHPGESSQFSLKEHWENVQGPGNKVNAVPRAASIGYTWFSCIVELCGSSSPSSLCTQGSLLACFMHKDGEKNPCGFS